MLTFVIPVHTHIQDITVMKQSNRNNQRDSEGKIEACEGRINVCRYDKYGINEIKEHLCHTVHGKKTEAESRDKNFIARKLKTH